MSTNIANFLSAATQKVEDARTALQITTIDFYTKGEGQNGRFFSLEIENGKFQKESFDSEITSGIGDSHTVYEQNSSYSYKSTYRMDEDAKNPLDRDHWRQTGVAYEEKQNGESVFSVERSEEPKESEKPWLDTHLNTNAQLVGGNIDAISHKESLIGVTLENEHHKLEVDAVGYETGGDAAISFGKDGINAQLSANAEVYLLRAEYEATYGPAYARAEAFVGAEAKADAELNFNPMNGDVNVGVGAEAFAGGKVEVSGGIQGDNGKLGGNAGVTYGIGGELNADVGIKDGKVQAEFDIGATLGLGVDLGFEVEVDAGKIASDVTSNVADGVSDAAGKGVDVAKDLAGGAGDVAKELTGRIPKMPW